MMSRHQHFTCNFNARYQYSVVLFHPERDDDHYRLQTVYHDEPLCDPAAMRCFINKYEKVIRDTTQIVKINRSDYHTRPGIWETVFISQTPNAM